MKHKIFYSWQADQDPKCTRYLIRDALTEAAVAVGPDYEVDEATRGVPGTPDIFSTILSKISVSSIFVPDLTLMGEYVDEKWTPNPNVLVEYGYALGSIGDGQIVPVMNTHFGPAKLLPFNLTGKVVRVQYKLEPDASTENIKQARRELAGLFTREIRLTVDQVLFQGLSEDARKVIEFLVTTSETGNTEPNLDYSEFCRSTALEDAAARQVVDELEGRGLIEKTSTVGKPIRAVRPTTRLFWTFDRVFMGWDTQADARLLAARLVEGNSHQLSPELTATELTWNVRRINPALTYLRDNGIADGSDSGHYPFAMYRLLETAETRRFVRGI